MTKSVYIWDVNPISVKNGMFVIFFFSIFLYVLNLREKSGACVSDPAFWNTFSDKSDLLHTRKFL